MLTNSAAVPKKPRTIAYNQRLAIDGVLDFAIKTHKFYYDQGCKRWYENYDVNPEGRYAFVTALSFKVNKFGWRNDTCGILDIPSDKYNPNGNGIYKFILEHDGDFNLPFLTEFVKTYMILNSWAAQDDAINRK